MNKAETVLQAKLFALRDVGYAAFQRKLIPSIAPETVIGVRMPALRKFAKEFSGQPEANEFLALLPHRYYEENNLHGLLIAQMTDYPATIAALDCFLPYVDNWATCDLISPPIFKQNLPALYEKIQCWLASAHSYTVRFGIDMLLTFFLDAGFRAEHLDLVAALRTEQYYVNMAIAWYFASALAKQPAAALPMMAAQRLDKWVQNKTIQKAVESYRISEETKTYLRTLKIK